MGLHKERGPRGVDASSNVLRGGHAGALTQRRWVLRNRNRVHIGDEEQAFVLRVFLHFHPVTDRTNIVAQVQGIRRGLRPRKHAGASCRRVGDIGCMRRGALRQVFHGHPCSFLG